MQKRTLVLAISLALTLVAIPLIVNAQQGQNRNPNRSQSASVNNQNANRQAGQRGNRQNQQMNNGDCLQFAELPDATVGELSDEVLVAMTDGIMDEYNAYNIYQAVIDQFGEIRPFVNIQNAEAKHISAWEFLFERYGVDIPEMPARDDSISFDSVQSACSAAAEAEIANFGLYDEMLVTLADYPDMVQVVTNLRDASELNHLPAFERCAE